MSNLAAHTSQEMNGVSWLHGEVSKDMFKHLWPGFFTEELHLGFVTNGVHYSTWAAKEMRQFYEERFNSTIVFAAFARFRSCVIIIIVLPFSFQSFWSIAITSFPVLLSRAPVGSSAKIISGSQAKARNNFV